MPFVIPRARGAVKHLPVAIIVDHSSSTEDIRELLNSCSKNLIQSMKKEVTFHGVVQLLVILYNHNYQTIVDFQPLESVADNALYIEKSTGATNTGKALLHALERLDEKKVQWKRAGEEYYQPLMFLLTDGYPDPGKGASDELREQVEQAYQAAANRIRSKESSDKIVFAAAGIEQKNGYHANMARLRELSSFSDRIITVTDADTGVNQIEQFYNLIKVATSATLANTPLDSIFQDIWDR